MLPYGRMIRGVTPLSWEDVVTDALVVHHAMQSLNCYLKNTLVELSCELLTQTYVLHAGER